MLLCSIYANKLLIHKTPLLGTYQSSHALNLVKLTFYKGVRQGLNRKEMVLRMLFLMIRILNLSRCATSDKRVLNTYLPFRFVSFVTMLWPDIFLWLRESPSQEYVNLLMLKYRDSTTLEINVAPGWPLGSKWPKG